MKLEAKTRLLAANPNYKALFRAGVKEIISRLSEQGLSAVSDKMPAEVMHWGQSQFNAAYKAFAKNGDSKGMDLARQIFAYGLLAKLYIVF